MVVVQVALLAFGMVGGLFLASRLRRQPWSPAQRVRNLMAFGAGAAAWVGFAAIALPALFAWIFLGTVVALYLPSLLVIVTSGAAPHRGGS